MFENGYCPGGIRSYLSIFLCVSTTSHRCVCPHVWYDRSGARWATKAIREFSNSDINRGGNKPQKSAPLTLTFIAMTECMLYVHYHDLDGLRLPVNTSFYWLLLVSCLPRFVCIIIYIIIICIASSWYCYTTFTSSSSIDPLKDVFEITILDKKTKIVRKHIELIVLSDCQNKGFQNNRRTK